MPIDERLLAILVCPACRGAVRVTEGERGIECRACERVYPVRDGIPVMLVEESTPRDRREAAP